MKRILLPLICLLFGFFQMTAQNHRVVSNTDNQLTFTVTTGELSLEDVSIEQGTFTHLMLNGCAASIDNVGKPELPMMVKTIEIPICGDIHVTATAGRVRTLTAEEAGIRHTIYPTQPQYSKSYTGDRTFVKDDGTYNTNASYGMPLATVTKAGISRDVNMADIRICPVNVNPVTNTVTIYDDITVTVTYDDVDMTATREMKQKFGSRAFGHPTQLINTIESVQTRDVLSTRPVKMLIIAHSMFEGQLDDFANWKRRKGFIVEIAYTSTIGTTTTAIKSYISSQFTNATTDNPAPTYVLLVGDNGQIPAFSSQISNSQYNDHITDLYYFTQVGNDNMPDCYYGRFSAQTMEQLTPQIDKTLCYEQLTMPDLTYLDRCVLVAGNDNGTTGDYGYSHGNPTIHYFEDNYAGQFFDSGNNGISSFYNPHASTDASTIRTKLSNGTGFANYTAHCSASGWGDPSFNTTHVASMTNTDKYGFMIGNCCLSNKFDESECFGEALLRLAKKGAVGYIGGSNSTLWHHDYYWAIGARGTLSTSCSNCNTASYQANNLGAYDRMCHTHGEVFSDWFVSQSSIIRAGDMAVQSVYGASDMYTLYYWEIYHLMGDPSVMPWLGQPNDMTIRVNNVAPVNSTCEVEDGTTTLSVSTGAPYSYVALTSNLNLITAVLTDANGDCTLTFPALSAGENYELAASAQNYKTTFTTLNVMVADGARVTITDVNVTNNVQATAGAHLTLDVAIENRYPDAATNTRINAATTSSHITLTDATENVGTVNSGTSRTLNAAFALNVGSAITDGEIAPIVFTVTYQSNGTTETTTYTYDLMLVDAFLDYVSDSYTISSGNSDNTIDPGETVTLTIVDENTGHATAQNVVSELSTYYTPATISNRSINIGTVNTQAQCTSTFTVSIGSSVPVGTRIPFYHHIYSTTNAALTRTDTVWLTVGSIEATEDWESNNFTQYEWTNNSQYPWTIVNDANEAIGGSYYAKSGNTGRRNTQSNLELTISTADGEISFYSKVAARPNSDYFAFYIDGTQMDTYNGGAQQTGLSYTDTCTWQRHAYPITAGTHTIQFSFVKGNSNSYSSYGSDCAKVDNITWPADNGVIAPVPPVLSDISHEVTIATGNNDSEINPGETLYLTITTENASEETLTNVSSVLSTTSPYATIASPAQTISSIPAAGTATTTYHITVAPNTPDSTVITFNHVASDGTHTSETYTASIHVYETASPRLVKVSDSYTISGGNSDNVIDPGETVTLTIVDENSGRADAPAVISQLSTYYALAAVTNGTINAGDIVAGDEYASAFTIHIDTAVPVGTIIPYTHHIFSATDARADRTDTIYLTVGSSEATEDWESGTFTQFGWTNNSTYPWVIVENADDVLGGSYYAKSGNAGHKNTQSDLELTINCTDGEISFFSKVAARYNYGFFRFYIDGVKLYEVSNGVQSSGTWGSYTDTCTWQYHAFPITAGTHTIKFSYERSNSVQNTPYGSDCAKVDNITWPVNGGGIAPMPEIVITSAGLSTNSHGYELEAATFDATIENTSSETIGNVILTMTTTSPNLTLTDTIETVATIAAGHSLDLTDIFAGTIAPVADGHIVNSTVTASYMNGDVPAQYSYHFNFTVHSAILQDMGHSEAITVGNGDMEVNPGETVEITVNTGNIGVAAISGVASELTTASSYATIANASQTIGSIAANGTAATTFTVTIDANTPDNADLVFTHTASDAVHGSTTLSFTLHVVELALPRLNDVSHNETILSGNNDQFVNPGEIVRINVNTRNDGRAAAHSAVSELTTSSPYATIGNGTQTIGVIASNASVNSQFDLTVAENAPDGTVINLTHTMYSIEDTCTLAFSLTVTSYVGTPILNDASYTISVISGNDDNDINPGETIKVTVYSQNDGDGAAGSITSSLTTTSSYATIAEPVVTFVAAAPNATLTSQFNVDIDPNTANNTTISFNHLITDGNTTGQLSFTILIVAPEEEEIDGVEENGLSTVTLYPNPTNSNVNVALGSGVRATEIRLINTIGQLISTTDVHDTVTVLHLSELPDGIYFIQIYNDNKLVTTGKVVKR